MYKAKAKLAAGLTAATLIAFVIVRLTPHQSITSAQEPKSLQRRQEHAKLYEEYEGERKISEIVAASRSYQALVSPSHSRLAR